MRARLELSTTDALASIPKAGKKVDEKFSQLFASKIAALSNADIDGDGGEGTQTFKNYLHHKAKARGVLIDNNILLHDFSRNVLDKILVRIGRDNAARKAMLKISDKDDFIGESIYDKESILSEEDYTVLIDEAIFDEFLETGVLDHLTHKIVDTTQKARSADNIIENYVLSGTGPDAVDNGFATPASRIGKLAFLAVPGTSSFMNIMGAIYGGIMYGFFAAMILYAIQLPALYIYRRLIKGDKNATLSKTEVTFGVICSLITVLTGIVVFVPAAVVLLYPFVIALFGLALIANVTGLGLLLHARHTTEKAYNASVQLIKNLQLEIKTLKSEREKLYETGANTVELAAINKKIADKSIQLKTAVSNHQQIKVSHEDAHSNKRLRYAIVGTVIAALVLAAFIVSALCPPIIALYAVAISAVLGTIGIGLMIAKVKQKFNLDVKGRRENIIDIDISTDDPAVQSLPGKEFEDDIRLQPVAIEPVSSNIYNESESVTEPLLREQKNITVERSSRSGMFGVTSRKRLPHSEVRNDHFINVDNAKTIEPGFSSRM